MKDLIDSLVAFRDARDWKKFHTPENLAKSVAIEAAELLECFQWGDNYEKKQIEDEIADVMIYCLLLTEAIGIDPEKAIREKIELNEVRFPVQIVKGTSGRSTKLKVK
jgi:NTP pyrophosphatase (non-canonical NTP hydrolase)